MYYHARYYSLLILLKYFNNIFKQFSLSSSIIKFVNAFKNTTFFKTKTLHVKSHFRVKSSVF